MGLKISVSSYKSKISTYFLKPIYAAFQLWDMTENLESFAV
jgi:hypothetical protein